MITAIIPARSGSKRLPDKNIKRLAGRPLVFHTIDSILNHKEITKIIFTTDSLEYIDIVKMEYGDNIDYELRPKEYASDTTKVYDEVKRLIDEKKIDTKWYMLCLPTAPLRDREIVCRALKQWKNDKKPLFSAVEYDFPVQFAFELLEDKKSWKAIQDDSPMITGNTRSQDIPKRYRPNGAIYLQHIKNINNKTFYIDAEVFLMSKENSVDIDTELDFLICEQIIKKSRYEK